MRDSVTIDPDVPASEGGFYVTPIHATLLPSGKIIVTGWSRAAKDSCTFPEGSRRNGASFILDPTDLDVPAGPGRRSLAITPLDEHVPTKPHWKSVLYCAGHSSVDQGLAEIALPASAFAAPPGDYLLFRVSRVERDDRGLPRR